MKPHVSGELIDQLVCGSLRGGEYRKAILAWKLSQSVGETITWLFCKSKLSLKS
ncbi:MAG: hypothetical protein U0930_21490 [Pirellulales bacterium]